MQDHIRPIPGTLARNTSVDKGGEALTFKLHPQDAAYDFHMAVDSFKSPVSPQYLTSPVPRFEAAPVLKFASPSPPSPTFRQPAAPPAALPASSSPRVADEALAPAPSPGDASSPASAAAPPAPVGEAVAAPAPASASQPPLPSGATENAPPPAWRQTDSPTTGSRGEEAEDKASPAAAAAAGPESAPAPPPPENAAGSGVFNSSAPNSPQSDMSSLPPTPLGGDWPATPGSCQTPTAEEGSEVPMSPVTASAAKPPSGSSQAPRRRSVVRRKTWHGTDKGPDGDAAFEGETQAARDHRRRSMDYMNAEKNKAQIDQDMAAWTLQQEAEAELAEQTPVVTYALRPNPTDEGEVAPRDPSQADSLTTHSRGEEAAMLSPQSDMSSLPPTPLGGDWPATPSSCQTPTAEEGSEVPMSPATASAARPPSGSSQAPRRRAVVRRKTWNGTDKGPDGDAAVEGETQAARDHRRRSMDYMNAEKNKAQIDQDAAAWTLQQEAEAELAEQAPVVTIAPLMTAAPPSPVIMQQVVPAGAAFSKPARRAGLPPVASLQVPPVQAPSSLPQQEAEPQPPASPGGLERGAKGEKDGGKKKGLMKKLFGRGSRKLLLC
eukprot:jgi/Mesen1/2818/ME000172S01975